MPKSRSHLLRLALLACGPLAACADQSPTTVPVPRGEVVRTEIACTASVAEGVLRCGAQGPDGVSPTITLGGQGTYVRLASSNISSAEGTFMVDVTVQNLLSQAMGTPDGTTATGIRVFFADGPTVTGGAGEVTLANPDGVGEFTAANQPYFEYPELLPARGSTAPRRWRFSYGPEVTRFTFVVYVRTELPAEQGVLRWTREAGALLPPDVGTLNSVWAAGPHDVFVAAQSSVLHFDGVEWTVVKHTGSWTRDISGNSPQDVYAVGDEGRVLHFDGTGWTYLTPATLNVALYGVWVQGRKVVAVGVGNNADDTKRVGKIYRSDDGGATWEVEESAGANDRQLLDVWGSGPDDLYAVGSDYVAGKAGSSSSLILHSTDGGATWQETLHPDDAERLYAAVWGWDAGNVLVGGMRTDSTTGRRQAVIMYSGDGGATWDETIIAAPGADRYVRGLWGTPTGEVYAVGFSGTRLRWSGTGWEDLSGPGPSLLAVHGTEEGNVFAVGSGQAIVRHDGTSWQQVSPVSHTNVTFRSVGGVGWEAFAVGHRPRVGGGGVEGVVFRRLDFGWTPAFTADSTEFTDVWGSGSVAFAVGRRIRSAASSSGVILRWNGAAWTDISPPFPRDRELTAVWGAGPDDVWVLGSQLRDDGWYALVALHSTDGGETWSAAETLLADVSRPYVLDVHGLPSGQAYAVGRTSSGRRLTMNLNATGLWEQEDFGVFIPGSVDGVSARAPGEVYGVSSYEIEFDYRGVVLKRNESGSSWDPWMEEERRESRYHGIWTSPAGRMYVVGEGTRIRHFDGTGWSDMGPDFAPVLRSIWGTSDDNVYAVGDNGLILHGTR